MNKLKQNIEIRCKGGNAEITSGDAKFDAAMSSNFRELIKQGKARMGKETTGTDGTNHKMQETQATIKSPLDLRSTEPLVPLADTSEITQHQRITPTEPPLTTPKPPHEKKKKSPSQPSISRIVSAGAWSCSDCTYYNERNTTSKARCEMCNATRKEKKTTIQDVETIDIDC